MGRRNVTVGLDEDLRDGRDLDGLVVVDPFRHEPASLLQG